MASTAAQRIDRTIALVAVEVAASAVGAAWHREILSWLRAWRRTAPPATLERLGVLMVEESVASRVASARRRAYLRAAILTECVVRLPEPQWAARAASLKGAGGDRATGYRRAMEGARDEIGSTRFQTGLMLAALRADPPGRSTAGA